MTQIVIDTEFLVNKQDGQLDHSLVLSDLIMLLDDLGASWEDYCMMGGLLYEEGQRLATLQEKSHEG